MRKASVAPMLEAKETRRSPPQKPKSAPAPRVIHTASGSDSAVTAT